MQWQQIAVGLASQILEGSLRRTDLAHTRQEYQQIANGLLDGPTGLRSQKIVQL